MSGADPGEREPVDADFFHLAGGGLEIVIGPGFPGSLELGYRGAPPLCTFGAHEILREDGPMGRSVSVSPAAPDDRDHITLTVLLPSARLPEGHRMPVSTLAILTVRRGRLGAPTDHVRRRNVIELDGHASSGPGLDRDPAPPGVTAGPTRFRAPSLIGLEVSAAHDAALDAGALAVLQHRRRAGATVTAQVPRAGHTLRRGESIRIWTDRES